MRLIILPIIATFGVSAVQPAQVPAAPDIATNELRFAEPADCRDRIEVVRDELGQPKLDRTPASAERPYLIAAVDKRVDGCAVMQMKDDVNDLRPLPELPEQAPRLQPLR